MTGARHDPDPAAREGLVEGRRRVRESGTPADPRTAAVAALQRSAGNAAVAALMAGRWRSRGEAVKKIDTALREIRQDEPEVATVEPGLRAAKDAGVPVDLDGYAQKPPASALNVVKTGFGPGAVPGRKPVPPPKPVPPKSPLAKASAPARKPAGPPGRAAAPPAPAAGPAPLPVHEPDPLAPPVPPTPVRPEDDPGFARVTTSVKGYAREKKAHPPAAAKAKEAQDAAVAPSGDVDGQAKAAKVDAMDAQRPGGFDKKAFIAAVKAAIEAKSPKNAQGGRRLQEVGKGRRGQGRREGTGHRRQAELRRGHRDGHRRNTRPVDGRAQAGHPDSRPSSPGQPPDDPRVRRRTQARPAGAAQPRGREARDRPGDGGR